MECGVKISTLYTHYLEAIQVWNSYRASCAARQPTGHGAWSTPTTVSLGTAMVSGTSASMISGAGTYPVPIPKAISRLALFRCRIYPDSVCTRQGVDEAAQFPLLPSWGPGLHPVMASRCAHCWRGSARSCHPGLSPPFRRPFGIGRLMPLAWVQTEISSICRH